jgi:hypothetical protein
VAQIVAQAAEQMGPAIAQLPGPHAKLVAGIHRRQRRAAGSRRLPAKISANCGLFRNSGGKPSRSATSRLTATTCGLGRERVEAGVESSGQGGETVVEGGQVERGFPGRSWV